MQSAVFKIISKVRSFENHRLVGSCNFLLVEVYYVKCVGLHVDLDQFFANLVYYRKILEIVYIFGSSFIGLQYDIVIMPLFIESIND
jgi:hypothetical protein